MKTDINQCLKNKAHFFKKVLERINKVNYITPYQQDADNNERELK